MQDLVALGVDENKAYEILLRRGARWKVIALDRMTGEPLHVDLETIENAPRPIGRVRYCAEVNNMRPERAVYISDIKVVYQYLFRPPSNSILDACKMVERDRNYA